MWAYDTDSGFFLHEDVNGGNYTEMVEWIVDRQNVSSGVNQECIRAYQEG